jgi:hypothetical protein
MMSETENAHRRLIARASVHPEETFRRRCR